MILTGNEIHEQVRRGRIRISEFDPARLSPNSYDLCLAPIVLQYLDEVLDPATEARTRPIDLSTAPYRMQPNEFLLGRSAARISTDSYVPILHAKSGIARRGLFVHVTGDLLQMGCDDCPSLQLFATLPIVLTASMSIAQISFWQPYGAS